MKEDKSILRLVINNPVSANVLMFIILVGGVLSYLLTVREIFPEVNFDMVMVSVPYPGADPDEIEEGICRPIEEALEGVSGAKKVTTIAKEGVGLAIVEILEGYEVGKIKDDVDNRINSITTFPTDAEKPLISQTQFRSEVLMLSIWGDLPLETLKETAYDIKDELINLEEISSITLIGDRNYEISIEVSEDKLAALKLTHNDVANALKASNLNLPAGQIYTPHEDVRLRMVGRRYNADEYRNIVLKAQADGSVIHLKDVAVIKDSFDPDNESVSLFNGKPCIVLQVNKTGLEDSILISKMVHEYVDKKKGELPPTVNLDIWSDNSRMINDRIDLLTRNGAIGLCLVFFFLWLFLDLRLSFWVTLGIPISISGAFIVMYLTGVSINMVSLFALILVLGIIVDDAIIVGESIYVHRENNSSIDASIKGTRKVLWPVFSAIITSVVAFLPLFFIDGILGKFIYVMPIPIIAALLISLVEALVILPTHLRHLPEKKEEKPKFILFKFTHGLRNFFGGGLMKIINNIYGPFLRVCIRWRYACMAGSVGIILLIAGLFQGGFLKFETFPSSDTDFLFTHIIMPVGTPLSETKKRTEQLIASWRKVEEKYKDKLEGKKLTNAIYSITGSNINPDDLPETGSHLSSIFVEMLPTESRNIFYKDIIEEWHKQTGFVSGAEEVLFEGFIGGPPTADIDVIFRGKNSDSIIAASTEFKEILETYNGVYEISSSYKKGKTEFRLNLKPEAENFGVTMSSIAQQIRDSYYGNEVMKIQRDRDEVRVMLRLTEEERRDISRLNTLKIRTNTGMEIPVNLLVDIEETNGFSVIEREGGQRLINVQASVIKGVNANEVMAELKKDVLPILAEKHHIVVEEGFNAQDTADTRTSMKEGFAVAVMVIYMILATIFKSYLQPMIIVFTIPFGIVGAIFGHYIYNLPVSTMSFFGMIALTGVVVNDSIVYIEAVNDRLEEGDSLVDALVSGGKTRFRAIILTTLTTFGGIFPMILEKSLQAQVLVPMAISVAFGLVFATFSTLVAIPCLLSIGNDLRRFFHILISGTVYNEEEVEPRSKFFHVREKRGGML